LAVIGSPNEPEVKVARQWRFPRGTVLLFDKAYTDYSWFDQLTDEGIWFVTRMRRDAHYEILEQREVPADSRVGQDSIIRLGAERRTMRQRLRRIELSPLQGHDEFVLLTNNLRWSAATVAQLYSQRWQIEQFFRALKQNLRLKSFVGTSANAVLIQIWTALIAILLLKYLMLRSRFGWSLSNLVAFLRLQLFVYRDLQAWLDEPLRAPPTPQGLFYEQLQLPLGQYLLGQQNGS
jgi:IS4 transposase